MKKLFYLPSIFLLITLNHTKAGNDMPGKDDLKGKKVVVYTTAESTKLRLTATDTVKFVDFGQPLETQPCVFVDPTKTFQTFVGIGGAITDASAETFAKLPKEKQKEIIQQYYDVNKGIGYSLARTNIHSCDFSSGSYTYVDEKDAALKSFSVAHDKEFRIPMIRCANTGITTIVDTKGVMRQTLRDENGSTFTDGVLMGVVQVPVNPRVTLFARWGDWFGTGCLVLAGLWAATGFKIALWRKRSKAAEIVSTHS